MEKIEVVDVVELDDVALEDVVGGLRIIIGDGNCGCGNNCNCAIEV